MKEGKELDGEQLADYTCSAVLLNNWDVPITNVLLKHTTDNYVNQLSVDQLAVAAESEHLGIQYQTGLFAPHDYWWVQFTAVGGQNPGTWTCKTNFYCDLRSSDAGTLVQIQVSGGDTNMYVNESSGQCYVSLNT